MMLCLIYLSIGAKTEPNPAEIYLQAIMNFLNNDSYLVVAPITAIIKFQTFTRTLYSFSSFHFRNPRSQAKIPVSNRFRCLVLLNLVFTRRGLSLKFAAVK